MAEGVGILGLGNLQRALMLIPLFARIKSQEPSATIILFCDGLIKEHKQLFKNVDEFVFIDPKDKNSFNRVYERSFDLFINTGTDEQSRRLSSKVNTKSFKGFVYDEYGNKKTDGLWFKYIEHMGDASFLNMLHFSDVICAASGFIVKEIAGITFDGIFNGTKEVFSFAPYGVGHQVNIDGVEWATGFDREGLLEYLPVSQINMSEEIFYGFIYRAVWKCTISRIIKAGDPQRFMSFGETFLDRMVDIDREVDRLLSKTFKNFNSDSIGRVMSVQENFLAKVVQIKELAFSGQKAAKELLSASTKSVHDMNEIKEIKKGIQNIELKIGELRSTTLLLAPLIDLFNAEDPVNDVKNLFPLAKSIMLSFEDLFARASFLEEIIKGLDKKIRGQINE